MLTYRVKHSVELESFVLEVGEDEIVLDMAETLEQAEHMAIEVLDSTI